MTESEAKTKWCPFVRLVFLNQIEPSTHAGNRFEWTDLKPDDELYGQRMSGLCIGSECMAWQATDNEIKENPDGPIEGGKAMKASDYVSAGYCGLAK